MRIQVACNDGHPSALFLGSQRLYVLRVIERTGEGSTQCFRVKVADGRVLLLNRELASGDWRLASVKRNAKNP